MTCTLICCSHSPLLEYMTPAGDVRAAVREAFGALGAQVRAFDPELIVVFAPDHFSGVFYDMMPAFCVGAAAESVNDYDSGAGPLAVPEPQAVALAEALRDAELDVALSYRLRVDHGVAQPLSLLTGGLDRYPVIPVFVNCIAPPRPSCRRVRRLGQAVGAWAAGLGRRVLFIGSGGLSHDPRFPAMATASPAARAALIAGPAPDAEAKARREQRTREIAEEFTRGEGRSRPLNPDWDRDMLALLTGGELARVDDFEDRWITEQAGSGGHELRCWIAAFAALAAGGAYSAQVDFYRPVPEWFVGMGIVHGAAD
ncbi:MAG: 3-carboxyethylcatechol 2,3-dioxygenase [Candidatus Lambdaproteobacteria bacterium]|nr:3-carboxyethylcatechol 2,3-dioxygenase [Candidatus Lambdaproteobacteria bacterium]